MKNLLERMKPEPLAKFNECSKKAPNSFKIIENELILNHYVGKLTFGAIVILCAELQIENIYKIHDIFND